MESRGDKAAIADHRTTDSIPAVTAARTADDASPEQESKKIDRSESTTKDAKTAKTKKQQKQKRSPKKSRTQKPKVESDDSSDDADSDSDSSLTSSSSDSESDEEELPKSKSRGKDKKSSRRRSSDTKRDSANTNPPADEKAKRIARRESLIAFLRGESSGRSLDVNGGNDGNTSSSNASIGNDGIDSLELQVRSLQLQVLQLQQQQQHPVGISTIGYPTHGFNPGLLSGYPTHAYPVGGIAPITTPAPVRSTQPPPPGLVRNPAANSRPLRGRARFEAGVPGQLEESTLTNDGTGNSNGDGDGDSGRKKGKRPEFKRVDWVWDTNIFAYKLQDTAQATTDSTYDDYAFHVRRTFDCEGKYRATIVDIKSKILRECLQDVIGNVRGVSLVDGTPKLDPNLLFLYLEDLREHVKSLKHASVTGETKQERKKAQKCLETKRQHLKVLIKYLDKDYAKVKESLYPMLDAGLITFELMWALWKPNTLAYTTTYGSTDEPRAFRVEIGEKQTSMMKGDYYFIDGKYFEFDGKRFGYGNLSEEISEFHGARKITSLPCYPLKYHKNEEKLRADLIERGKRFVELSGVNYKSYSGMAYQKRKKNGILKFNIQHSRVMVDPGIFRRINPNYYVSLVRPQDHDSLSDDEDESDEGCCSDEDKVKFVTRVFKTKHGEQYLAQVPKDQVEALEATEDQLDALPTRSDESTEQGDSNSEQTEFTDEEYLIASPLLLGFAFSEKQWLEFSVSGIKDIKWNDAAWDSLVLEPSTKDLIQALVKSRKFNAAQTIDDVIQGKGKGLVTVLHGPPGTGKTLTAEGISELLRCPLYMASAGELSTDSRYLEQELQKILDICHAWGAILLLDEADVFLEKRNMHDIHRNALVSIFLRQLEYFQGILFLTTNRVETFDEAFQSRIHIALRYDNLDAKAKKAIFRMFLDRVQALGKLKLDEFTDEDLTTLAKNELNGREIKNVIGSAQDLAVNKGEPLGMRHIRQVLAVHAKFGRDLKGGTGYEDAMRSYF
ncbi:hypothetical protein S40293_01540 [Stachybotrys chartarum IBT 40293]|nr:hypothetical protein S40293_01540 [Stachybotrys chartarum IBT 40293]